MKKSLLRSLAVLAIPMVLSLYSCNKDENTTNDTQLKQEKFQKLLALQQDFSFADQIFYESVLNMDDPIGGGRQSFVKHTIAKLKDLGPCAEAVTVYNPDGSLELTMDYGAGCQNDEGVSVSGKIVVTLAFSDTSYDYELEFVNYTEAGPDSQGEVYNGTVSGSTSFASTTSFNIDSDEDLTVTYADQTQASYTVSMKSQLTETELKMTEFSGSGTLQDNTTFTMSVTSPLVYKVDCTNDMPVSGKMNVTVDQVQMTVDYGNGVCDELYTIN